MIGLRKQLSEEMTKLEKIKYIVDERLRDAPEGRLRISSTGKYTQYYFCTNDTSPNGYYLPKEKQANICALAQKTYDKKLKKLVDKRLKQFQMITKDQTDDEIDTISKFYQPASKLCCAVVVQIYAKLLTYD